MAVDAYFIILLVIECILYMFHLSILLLLIVKRKTAFKGPFYNIFRMVLVADFTNFIALSISQKVSMIPFLIDFYKTSTFLPPFMNLSITFLSAIQFFGRFLMAFNRFTSIWFPMRYQKFWSQQWYTVLILLVPFLTICWRLHEPVRYIYSLSGSASASYTNPSIPPIVKAVSALTYFITTMGAAILNGLFIGKFLYNKQKLFNYRLNEQHLLYMSIIILIAQLLRTSYPVAQYLFPTNTDVISFFSTNLSVFNDVLALSGSISFFLLSKVARKEYAIFYFNKKSNVIILKTTTFGTGPLGKPYGWGVWVGLYSVDENYTWKWSDATSIDYVPWLYGADGPMNLEVNVSCVLASPYYDPRGSLINDLCNNQNYYVCQLPALN